MVFYIPRVMQGATVMGLASMAPVSKLPMAPTFAIVRKDGMVQNAMCQVTFCVSRLSKSDIPLDTYPVSGQIQSFEAV